MLYSFSSRFCAMMKKVMYVEGIIFHVIRLLIMVSLSVKRGTFGDELPSHYFSSGKLRTYREPFEYSVELIDEPRIANLAVEEIYWRTRNFPVIGLNCKWTQKEPGVTLLQIATIDGTCVLIRTSMMAEIPYYLEDILADPGILKVGVGMSVKAARLKNEFRNLKLYGCFDLKQLADVCNITREKMSLGGLSKALLGLDLQHDNRLKCGWGMVYLKEVCIRYAALDTVVSVKIFQEFLPSLHKQESNISEPFNERELIERNFIGENSVYYQFRDPKM